MIGHVLVRFRTAMVYVWILWVFGQLDSLLIQRLGRVGEVSSPVRSVRSVRSAMLVRSMSSARSVRSVRPVASVRSVRSVRSVGSVRSVRSFYPLSHLMIMLGSCCGHADQVGVMLGSSRYHVEIKPGSCWAQVGGMLVVFWKPTCSGEL